MFKLRELERKDLSVINGWRNNDELIEFLGAPFRFINEEVDICWFENYMSNRNSTVRCSILDDGDNVIGLVSLTNINYLNQSAEFHIMIGESDKRNRGAGTFAINNMIYHAFMNMNLQRIELSVLEENQRAIHLYEKCGFTREGKKRNACYKKGMFHNMYMYSLLRDDVDLQEMEKNTCLPGGGKLPVYSIEKIDELHVKKQIMQECDTAFLERSQSYALNDNMMKKVHLCGAFFHAYCKETMGYAVVYANDYKTWNAYLTLICVKAAWQRNGIGESLLKQCEQFSIENFMQSLTLEVKKSNDSAIRFYHKYGYKFWKEAGQKSIYMRKSLLWE